MYSAMNAASYSNTMRAPPQYPIYARELPNVIGMSMMEMNDFQTNLRSSEKKAKRTRTAFSGLQIKEMELEFAKNQYLTRSKRIDMAIKLKLEEKQVKVWFQNRRMKIKKTENGEARKVVVKRPDSRASSSSQISTSPVPTNKKHEAHERQDVVSRLMLFSKDVPLRSQQARDIQMRNQLQQSMQTQCPVNDLQSMLSVQPAAPCYQAIMPMQPPVPHLLPGMQIKQEVPVKQEIAATALNTPDHNIQPTNNTFIPPMNDMTKYYQQPEEQWTFNAEPTKSFCLGSDEMYINNNFQATTSNDIFDSAGYIPNGGFSSLAGSFRYSNPFWN